MMSAQITQLQQTLHMSMLDKSLNLGAASVIEMLEDMHQQQTEATHPSKGHVFDIQA